MSASAIVPSRIIVEVTVPDGSVTVPVNVGEASGALRSNAVWVAVETGLLASVVLSTFARPTSDFVIPVGVLITGDVRVLLVRVCVSDVPTIFPVVP
jgi:hypothetical protein